MAWGVALVDLDLDGWVDMPIVNGDVFHRPAPSGDPRQRGLLFRNVGQGIFEDITATCEYLNQLHNSRGMAVADFDRDSLPDILVGNLNEPSGLLANRSTKQGHGLWIELVGTKSPRDPVGATVKLYCGKNVFAGYWTSGGSYLSSHERRLFFGLGPNTKIDVIEVTWPSGLRERFADQAVDGGFVIVEEQGIVFPAQGAGVQ